MTAIADAKPCMTMDWKQYNWDQARWNVQRLQTRIVKAWKTGKYKTAKSLQRLLLRSLSARMLAVRQVTTNHGKKTPGIDGIIWKYPGEKEKAAIGSCVKRDHLNGFSKPILRDVSTTLVMIG